MATKRRRKPTLSGTQMQSGPTISDLPSNIVVEILLKAPVKAIVTCKSVSKAWLGLVSDPQFAKLHLARAKPCPLVRDGEEMRISRRLFLLDEEDGSGFHSGYCWCSKTTKKKKKNNCEICCSNKLVKSKLKIPIRNLDLMLDKVDSDDDETSVTFCTLTTKKWKNLVKLRSGTRYRYGIVNSCNGLLCLSLPLFCHDNVTPVVVCNPITGEFISLPEPHHDRSNGHLDIKVCGLGFSPEKNQYKVVRLLTTSAAQIVSAEVHTLGTDSWRRLDISGFKSRPGRVDNSSCLNGALHWVLRTSSEELRCLVSFDLDTELFRFGSLPNLPRFRGESPELATVILGGRLCVFSSFSNRSVNIWAMNDYGVSDSWTKLFSDEVSSDKRSPLRSYYEVLSCFDNGALLMFSGSLSNEFICYDRAQGMRFKHLKLDDLKTDFDVVAHTPSLVSLKGIVGSGNCEVLNVNSRCGDLKLDEENHSLWVCGGELKYF